MNMHLTRPFLLAGGGLAIVAIFFFGTLFVIDYFALDFNGPGARDRLRAKHAVMLKDALANYKKTVGTYPTLSDNDVDDLKKYLVDGGYISAIPTDPLRAAAGSKYRFSSNGTFYGLLFQLEAATGKIPAHGACLTGVGTAGTGMWGQPPDCPF
jgi:hypothetical protein